MHLCRGQPDLPLQVGSVCVYSFCLHIQTISQQEAVLKATAVRSPVPVMSSIHPPCHTLHYHMYGASP